MSQQTEDVLRELRELSMDVDGGPDDGVTVTRSERDDTCAPSDGEHDEALLALESALDDEANSALQNAIRELEQRAATER
jgi:hypothetical protein